MESKRVGADLVLEDFFVKFRNFASSEKTWLVRYPTLMPKIRVRNKKSAFRRVFFNGENFMDIRALSAVFTILLEKKGFYAIIKEDLRSYD